MCFPRYPSSCKSVLHMPMYLLEIRTTPARSHISNLLPAAACWQCVRQWPWGRTLLRAWPPLLLPCGRPSRAPEPCAAADASSTDDWISVRTAVSAAGQGGPGNPYRNLHFYCRQRCNAERRLPTVQAQGKGQGTLCSGLGFSCANAGATQAAGGFVSILIMAHEHARVELAVWNIQKACARRPVTLPSDHHG